MDVCGLVEEESDAVDDMLNVMETLDGGDDFTQSTSTTSPTTTSTMTSGLGVSADVEIESSEAACSTLSDSDVGKALDVALQNGIDGLLSTIGDDQMAKTASSENPGDLLLATSVLPAASTETDQHYLFYSAETDELIDTFLRSTDAVDNEAETAVLGELQAVQLSAEDWQAESLNDVQMLVEFDSSLLTIIELENDQMPVDTEACLTVAPGGGIGQVVSDDMTAWNVFQGLEVSQFQVVTSEQAAETPPEGSPKLDNCSDDDGSQNALDEGADEREPDWIAPSTEEVDLSATALQSNHKPSNSSADSSDDEYVMIVDCVDGSEQDELEYEIVDEAGTATGSSAATTPEAVEQTQEEIDDVCDEAAMNSSPHSDTVTDTE